MAVRCQQCGKQNPETEAFCKHCGRELAQAASRNCVSCGRSISWDTLVCPFCGKDYRWQRLAPEPQQPLVSTGMKILLYVLSFFIPTVGFIIGAIYYSKAEREYKDVGKICIVLGIISIILAFGLAALLYVMVLGFDGTDGRTPAVIVISKTSIDGGFKFTFSATTSEVVWSDITFQLSEETSFVSWQPKTQDLTSASGSVTYPYGVRAGLTGVDVEMVATDIAGNGRMSMGDYITLTAADGAFSVATTYTLTLIHEPTGGAMTNYVFTG